MGDDKATAADWRLARTRGVVSVFELACLLHGKAPRLVFNAMTEELRMRDGRIGPEYAQAMAWPAATLGRLAAMPEAMLGDGLGGTLRTLLQVTGLPVNDGLPLEDARRLADELALGWPDGLSDDAPRAQPATADNRAQTPAERQARRLARFRALGGDLRRAGERWHTTGRRGALAELVREEASAEVPMARRVNVKADLEAEIERHR